MHAQGAADRDFALIEDLELSGVRQVCSAARNGARESPSSSMLSRSLLTGARASSEVVRTGAQRAMLSGSFLPNAGALALLEEWGMQGGRGADHLTGDQAWAAAVNAGSTAT